jgi:hypothetical protein
VRGEFGHVGNHGGEAARSEVSQAVDVSRCAMAPVIGAIDCIARPVEGVGEAGVTREMLSHTMGNLDDPFRLGRGRSAISGEAGSVTGPELETFD